MTLAEASPLREKFGVAAPACETEALLAWQPAPGRAKSSGYVILFSEVSYAGHCGRGRPECRAVPATCGRWTDTCFTMVRPNYGSSFVFKPTADIQSPRKPEEAQGGAEGHAGCHRRQHLSVDDAGPQCRADSRSGNIEIIQWPAMRGIQVLGMQRLRSDGHGRGNRGTRMPSAEQDTETIRALLARRNG